MPTPVISPPQPCPTSLAELALAGSISGSTDWALQPHLLGTVLRQFWSASRGLQHEWLYDLSRIDPELTAETDRFEKVALELFLTELLTRVWATNWTTSDRAQGHGDVERILVNTLHGLSRVRREVLLLMVRNWQGKSAELVSRIDRFRRRSERWTDLLIAGPATAHGVWDFTVESDRARDFGIETQSKQSSLANPISLLVSAGLRVMFGSPWPLGCCRGQPFAELMTAILSTLPATAFHDDGTLRPAWEWQKG